MVHKSAFEALIEHSVGVHDSDAFVSFTEYVLGQVDQETHVKIMDGLRDLVKDTPANMPSGDLVIQSFQMLLKEPDVVISRLKTSDLLLSKVLTTAETFARDHQDYSNRQSALLSSILAEVFSGKQDLALANILIRHFRDLDDDKDFTLPSRKDLFGPVDAQDIHTTMTRLIAAESLSQYRGDFTGMKGDDNYEGLADEVFHTTHASAYHIGAVARACDVGDTLKALTHTFGKGVLVLLVNVKPAYFKEISCKLLKDALKEITGVHPSLALVFKPLDKALSGGLGFKNMRFEAYEGCLHDFYNEVVKDQFTF